MLLWVLIIKEKAQGQAAQRQRLGKERGDSYGFQYILLQRAATEAEGGAEGGGEGQPGGGQGGGVGEASIGEDGCLCN